MIQNLIDIKEDWLQWLTSIFDKKSSESGVAVESNYQLASELHKEFIRTFKRRKVYSSFRDNI